MVDSPAPQARRDLCEALFDPPLPARGSAMSGGRFAINEIHDAKPGPPIFRMEGTVAAPLRLTAAMIREFDLGNLTGNLTTWAVLESGRTEPFRQRLFYVSKLPWPFRPRAFYIGNWVERPGPDSFAMLATSLEPDDAVRARVRNEVWSEVLFSGYHLIPLADRSTWLRRVIGIELALSMPRRLLRRMLIEVYRGNYKWLNEAPRSAELLRRYDERMANDPIYATLPPDSD
jgi:hypothetical protein